MLSQRRSASSSSISPSTFSSQSDTEGKKESVIPQTFDGYVQTFLAGLAQKGVILTEWGPLLHVRHDVPLVVIEYDFLVDDSLLELACHFAEEQGFQSTKSNPEFLSLNGEYEAIASHFSLFDRRMNLYPASFAGFRSNELDLAPSILGGVTETAPVFVAKLAPLVACLVRLISGFCINNVARRHLVSHLITVIAYTLFDMSYEGAYMTFDISQKEMDKNTDSALALYHTWKGWRKDEMWIVDAVEWIIWGKCRVEFLPSKSS